MIISPFNQFSSSIEQIEVHDINRSALDRIDTHVTVDCIVKRRDSMAEAVAEGEDYNNATSIHFRQEDAAYIQVGRYVKLDGKLRSIIQVRDGRDFGLGLSIFPYAFIGNDILEQDENTWGDDVSS